MTRTLFVVEPILNVEFNPLLKSSAGASYYLPGHFCTKDGARGPAAQWSQQRGAFPAVE